jgi:hypothetical protein
MMQPASGSILGAILTLVMLDVKLRVTDVSKSFVLFTFMHRRYDRPAIRGRKYRFAPKTVVLEGCRATSPSFCELETQNYFSKSQLSNLM